MAEENLFADFLIARRSELRPADVGMPTGGRRRTPGLRREEVAVRAGVSVDYLARLEQGRDRNPSAAVLGALADALLLDDTDRRHFSMLALASGTTSSCREDSGLCPGATTPQEQLPESIETILRALNPTPAFVVGRRLNVLGWNSAWADFVTPLGLLDGGHGPNMAWFTFMNPNARKVIRDWSAAADHFVAALHRAKARWPADDTLRATIDALRKEPEFAKRWKSHRIGEDASGTLHFDHPEHGTVEVPFEMMSADRDQSVVVWLTDKVETNARGLRLVSGD
ncbi:helix-turn-helix transcriptional regulator [Nocardia sp. NPDC051832]|uniref:helix-turn-helix domain-containing protein n=1 Tax=Nocardia sp. NPDC051832 TaxID=3155673 RepID=UPI00343E8D63